ncbi:hypothetical protein [Pedobacter sp. Hv1]|uniref:hypothetical protein n=1 Tax=Pedobacter sp. Hv1 TaxID=1740090 RepID=UPI0006D8AA09|nr:hypothetical protein [Pedobacter sp. Hv1]KQB99594.1 hypothetical protein AQF98_18755 [Pedobacter sp. Hv1]
MNKAITKDIEKQYLEAVKYYKEEIDTNTFPPLDYFINLAFLYWSFATEQIEFNDPNHIPDEWSVIGEKNFMPTIDKGLEYYHNNIELIFWRRYFSYRLYMSDFSEDDCKIILKTNDGHDSLVPYFFLYLFDKTSYEKQIIDLRKICDDLPTAKNIYINSFIQK